MKRKNILKEAGVLLIAAILVLTSIVFVPTTFAQIPEHDVGIESIDKPKTGCPEEHMPVIVTVKNYGNCTEITDVQVTIIKSSGEPEYDEVMKDIWVPYNGQVQVQFSPPDALSYWIPSDWPDPCFDVNYIVTARTLLVDDNSGNDRKNKNIRLHCDPVVMITNLITTVAGMGLDNGVKNDLTAKLNTAKNFLLITPINKVQALSHLGNPTGFLSRVTHWSTYPPHPTPGLTPAQATLLTNAAQSIIDTLNNCY